MINRPQRHDRWKSWIQSPWFIILAVVLLAAAIGSVFSFGWLVASGVWVALAGWGSVIFLRVLLQDRDCQIREEQQHLKVTHDLQLKFELRLKAFAQINRCLADASVGTINAQTLMDSVLSTLSEMLGVSGCSFVPIDEWQQPLPAFTHGQLPEPVLKAWAAQLAVGMLRERCGNCEVLQSTPGACPLHPAQVGNTLTVYCVPLPGDIQKKTNSSPVGVFHFYYPAGHMLDAETRHFLDDLLNQIAIAYTAARLREQEQVTFRQLQLLHAPDGDFTASLGVLLEGVVQALEVNFAIIRVWPVADERLASLNVQHGDFSGFEDQEIEQIVNHAFGLALQGHSSSSDPGSLPAWLALPLSLPDGVLSDGRGPGGGRGVLWVGANHPYEFHPRQRSILQAVAAQASLLVENERMIRSLEYKIVIQERARLAREIHDGLAQTLAFLKLQAAQMQSYLAQGDLTRLARILKDNYQVLADAYLDTRQAIDDLRLTPQQGLDHWIARILSEFESATGLLIERNIQPLDRPLSQEIQAQLIRIVQEALSNVRKHARARRVRVCLFAQEGEIILEVSDDGQGFSAEDVPEVTQHGLRGMRERAEMIGADFQIISQALQGTTMRLILPTTLAEETSS